MALTESNSMLLGSAAPEFSLPSTEGGTVSLADFEPSDALVVLFICNHCPYVIHIAPALALLAREYQAKGIAFVAISSNDVELYPQDDLKHMKQERAKWGYDFPYVLDETQSVAHAYQAACTPDIFMFDKARKLVFKGQFDETRPHRISSGNYDASNGAATGQNLKQALDQYLSGESIPEQQTPCMGCNIKWKPGNEPSYF